jgi:flagellar biosynthesis/type III secretory pathway protein FliH
VTARVVRPRSRIVRGEIADASAEARRIRDQARRDGFEAGRREGLAAAAGVLVAAQVEAGRRLDRSAADVARIAVHAARTLLGAELSARPDLVRETVDRALNRARRGRRLLLHVNPADVETLGELPPNLEVVADVSIARGGCLVRDGKRTIDARLETRIDAIRRALHGDP